MRPCCRTDLGREYARKLEQLRREEELIQEEELEAEALAEVEEDAVKKVRICPLSDPGALYHNISAAEQAQCSLMITCRRHRLQKVTIEDGKI